ncbi:hypothetical protein [Flavobacterium sp.]|uniref:hypothetical protein n=1 Tax=Flavobacterium sp. TaxID=239 RepID=UPI0025BD1B2E|nr:hypothetical protein [Flavobacterium sp.]MBA4154827.1 hypothetical protein [Flavobacterium sp.]
MQNNVTTLSTNLKNLIRKYEHKTFIAHWSFYTNMHYRNNSVLKVELKSPIRQLTYLISLYHRTGFGGNERFEAYSDDYTKIVNLLNDIEEQYSITSEEYKNSGFNSENAEKLFISNSTFLNFYLNAPLTYTEQDIEKIRKTFIHFESLIVEEYGLTIDDFINFYIGLCNLETERYEKYYDHTHEQRDLILKARDYPEDLTRQEASELLEITDNGIFNLGIPIERVKSLLPEDKIKNLLAIFTLTREENVNYLYYSDSCPYLLQPILLMDGDHLVMIFSKQLINATYDFLFDFCSTIDSDGRRVLDQRENYLEVKTADLFKSFFGKKAKVYTNYYVTKQEKDLLVVINKYAFIIECKANKYRIPFRDPLKAFDRIKDDFKRSIGKGYLQAREMEELVLTGQPFHIKNHRGEIIDKIYPGKIHEVFSIVVTQERFGQIECNLAHLLEVEDDNDYPWAIAVDDLETFLITLSRKQNHLQEFVTYLTAREKLHGRLFCYDELDLGALFLMQPKVFFSYCNHFAPVIMSPDMNKFFDELYSIGLGFKNELHLDKKKQREAPIAYALLKELKLGKPKM